MTNESKASRNFVNSLFWSCTTCNLRFWKKWQNLRNCTVSTVSSHWTAPSWQHLMNSYFQNNPRVFSASTTIAQMQMPREMRTETSILRSFTAHPLKVAHGIAALARHGINKLVQAASADPNTEFCSILSVSSPWWSLEKCTKTGMTNESKAGLWNHEGATF